MSKEKENNRRIAKNTILLYFRMFVMMGISLYTSRIILKTLGVEDYGIYNVVGGIVSMLGIIKGVVGGGASRFITYALGKGDISEINKIFNVCFLLNAGICVVLVILAETVGLFFLNTQMSIPAERLFAANCVYQCTIVSSINIFLAVPYNSIIIAHEKMNAFAYISIVEALIKLLIAYALFMVSFDRLIVYAVLLVFSDLFIRMLYRIYSIRNFKSECEFHFYRDKSIYKEILSYSIWNLFGSASAMVKGQGLNILLNLFFNPSVNAARGIAYQINNVVNQFTTNFYTAVRPQITKYYSKNEIGSMVKLVFRSSKMSFYLILIVSLPIVIEAPFLVKLWLGQLPEYVVEFVRYIIIISALEGMAHPLMTTAHATGKIALYQSTVGTMVMLNVPISFFLLKNGFPPVTVFQVSAVIAVICLFMRLWIVKRLVDFPVWRYSKEVFFGSLFVTLFSALVPMILYLNMNETFFSVFFICVMCFLSTIVSIYTFGLNKEEKAIFLRLIKNRIKKNDRTCSQE